LTQQASIKPRGTQRCGSVMRQSSLCESKLKPLRSNPRRPPETAAR
jgi:hypothetical protein